MQYLSTNFPCCRNLSQLPNFAYSVALATFHLSLTNPELRQANRKPIFWDPDPLNEIEK